MRGYVWLNFDVPFPMSLGDDWVPIHDASPPVLARVRRTEGVTRQDASQTMFLKVEQDPPARSVDIAAAERAHLLSARFDPTTYLVTGVLADGREELVGTTRMGAAAERTSRWEFAEADVVFAMGDLPKAMTDGVYGRLVATGLEHFNRLGALYGCVTGDFRVRRVTMHDLTSVRILWRAARVEEKTTTASAYDLRAVVANPDRFRGMEEGPSAPVVHLRVDPLRIHQPPSSEAVQVLSDMAVRGVTAPLHVEILMEAMRLLKDQANPTLAVVVGETAVEALLRNRVMSTLIADGMTGPDAEVALEDKYAGPIRKWERLSAWLAGQGKPRLDASVKSVWDRDMYKIRKDLAHEGSAASEDQAKIGLQAAAVLMEHVEDALPPNTGTARVVGLGGLVTHLVNL